MKTNVYFSLPIDAATFGRYSGLVTLAGSRDDEVKKNTTIDRQIVQNIASLTLPHFLQGWYAYSLSPSEAKATPNIAAQAFIQEANENDVTVLGFQCYFEVLIDDVTPVGLTDSLITNEDGTTRQATFVEWCASSRPLSEVDGDYYVCSQSHWDGGRTGDADRCMNQADLKLMLDGGFSFLTISEFRELPRGE